MRVIAEHSLTEQIEAHAVTWLDRQAFGDRPDARTADTSGGAGSHAASGKNGSFETGMRSDPAATGAVDLLPDALRRTCRRGTGRRGRTAGRQVRPAGERIAPGRHGRPANTAAPRHLHSGKLAVVVTEEERVRLPGFADPDVGAGSEVELQRTSAARMPPLKWRRDKRWIGMRALSLDGPGGD